MMERVELRFGSVSILLDAEVAGGYASIPELDRRVAFGDGVPFEYLTPRLQAQLRGYRPDTHGILVRPEAAPAPPPPWEPKLAAQVAAWNPWMPFLLVFGLVAVVALGLSALGGDGGGGGENGGGGGGNGRGTITTRCPELHLSSQPLEGEILLEKPFEFVFGAGGGTGALSWTLVDGELPPPLTLTSEGTLSGTPMEVGTFPFTVQVADECPAGRQTAQFASRLTVTANPTPCPLLGIDESNVPHGASVGEPYRFTFSASGGMGKVTWKLIDGELPLVTGEGPIEERIEKLTAQGAMNWTPAEAGVFPFTVQASDTCSPPQVDTWSTSLKVVAAGPCTPLELNKTPRIPPGLQGVPYEGVQFRARSAEGSVEWRINSGHLPRGIKLDLDGTLSGTPRELGQFPFEVVATDTCQPPRTDGFAAILKIEPAPGTVANCTEITFHGPSSVDLNLGQERTYDPGVRGGYPPLTLRVSQQGGSLPEGLSIDGLVITGIPLEVGPSSVILEVRDTCPGGSRSKTFSVTFSVLDPQGPD